MIEEELEAALGAEDPEEALAAWGRAGRLEEGFDRLRNSLARAKVKGGKKRDRLLAAAWRAGFGLGDPWLQFPAGICVGAVAPVAPRVAVGTFGNLVEVFEGPGLAREVRFEMPRRPEYLGFHGPALLAACEHHDATALWVKRWVPGSPEPTGRVLPTPGIPWPALRAASADGTRGVIDSRKGAVALVDLAEESPLVPVQVVDGENRDRTFIRGASFSPDGAHLLLHTQEFHGTEAGDRFDIHRVLLVDPRDGSARRLAVSCKELLDVRWLEAPARVRIHALPDEEPVIYASSYLEWETGPEPEPRTTTVALTDAASGEHLGAEDLPAPEALPALETDADVLRVGKHPRFPAGARPWFHAAPITALRLADAGRLLVSRDRADVCHVWDLATGLPIRRVALGEDEHLLVAAEAPVALRSKDGATWRRFPLRGKGAATSLPTGMPAGRTPDSFALAPAGDRMVLTNFQREVLLHDLAEDELAAPLAPPAGDAYPRRCGFGPDGTWVWVLTGDPPSLEIGGAAPGETRTAHALPGDTSYDLRVHALEGDRRCLVEGRGFLALVDPRAGEPVRVLREGEDLQVLARSPDARRLVLASADAGLEYLETDGPELRYRSLPSPLAEDAGRRGAMLFLPGGASLLVAVLGHVRLVAWPNRPT